MGNSVERLGTLSEELKLISLISNVEFKARRPARESLIKDLRRTAKFVLNPALHTIFLESNGLAATWDYCPSKEEDYPSDIISGGELNLPSMADIYVWPTKDKLWYDGMEKLGDQGARSKAFCQGLRILENLLASTDGVFIVMTPEWLGNQLNYTDPKILYWNTTGGKYLLTLTLADYFGACLEAKAFTGWQCFYVDQAGMDFSDPFVTRYFCNNFDEAREKRERFLREMPRLFPEMDFTKFEELHRQLG